MKKLILSEIQNSIYSEIDLLNLIIESPLDFENSEDIITALKSQNNLAKYSNKELGIIPLSLNTHKLYINKYSDTTYLQYNDLRIRALNKCHTQESPKIEKITDLKIEDKKLKICNMTLTKIIFDLKSTIKNLASNSNNQKTIDEINLKLMQFEKILSYNDDVFKNEK